MSIQTQTIQQSLLRVTATAWGLRAPALLLSAAAQQVNKVRYAAPVLGFSIAY